MSEPPRSSERRSRSPAARSAGADAIVSQATERLAALCEEAAIPESHGMFHAKRVLAHAEKSLAAAALLPEPSALAVRLAALLHDADDKKYFKNQKDGPYRNATKIMRDCNSGDEVLKLALRMIDLVSCSKNGNSCPEDAKAKPELLWPRWADRLEAAGEIGVVRCYQYNQEGAGPCSACGEAPKRSCLACGGTGLAGKAPMCCPDTPRPNDENQVWELATPELFQQYQDTKGKSKSMMDHYYDKLLRVACPPFEIVQNSYFEEEMSKGAKPLIEICLAYGKTGQVPLAEIEALEAKFHSGGA